MDSNSVDLDELKLKVIRLDEFSQILLEIQIDLKMVDPQSRPQRNKPT